MDDFAKTTDLDVIRVETALSRFPVHQLSKAGAIDIEIREHDAAGAVSLRWEVAHNTKYGPPGPLAYKVDTLVIARKIEAAGRPVPRILRLGSLAEIARMTGTGDHNTGLIKRALYANASAFITAKIRYRSTDGARKGMEIGSTRYGVVLTGEKLPDGRKADAVHVVLSDFFMEILNTALTRPLDYEYLRTLPPAPQRLYELLSYQIYAALKGGRPAKLMYSEVCTFAPLTRYETFTQVKKQMWEVHDPHRKAGYIADIDYESTVDADGRPDWAIIYTPGPRAAAEYRRFVARGGRPVLEVVGPAADLPLFPAPAPAGPEVAALVERGVTPAMAARLAGAHDAGEVAEKIDAFDWLQGRRDKVLRANPAGYLVKSITDGFADPPGYVGRAARREQDRARLDQQGREQAARRARAEERAADARVAAFWKALAPEERKRLDAEAIAGAAPEARAACEAGPAVVRRLAVAMARDGHIRRLLAAGILTAP